MEMSQVMDVFREAMLVALKVAAPILIVSILIGLIISVFQAATQIHEQTLTFVPKLLAIAVILIVMGNWMMSVMKDFTLYIFETALRLV